MPGKIRKISAHYIYPVNSSPIKNGTIVLDESDQIIDIIDPNGKFKELPNVEFYNGILIPGLVDCNTSIEMLSYDFSLIDAQLFDRGIRLVGDFCSTQRLLTQKMKGKITYHNFIEVDPVNNDNEYHLKKGLDIYNAYIKSGLSSSISCMETWRITPSFINLLLECTDEIVPFAIRNQLSKDENRLYIEQSGKLYEQLITSNAPLHRFKFERKNPLQTHLENIKKFQRTLLIGNLYSDEPTISKLLELSNEIYVVVTPSDFYTTKDVSLSVNKFFNLSQNVVLSGTSNFISAISNIFEEMKILSSKTDLSFSQILKSATINSAKALGFDDKFGSFEIGKNPGINLISGFNFENNSLGSSSNLIPIV